MRVILTTMAFALSSGGAGYAAYNIAGHFKGISQADRISLTFLFGFSISIAILFLLATARWLSILGVVTVSTTTAFAAIVFFSSRSRSHVASQSLRLEGKDSQVPASLLAGFLAMQILLGLLVSPFEWDSVAYHLPFAVQYLQEGAFTPWKSPFWTYPCIYEMLLAWILLLFQGDFGVHLLNVIFLLFMLVTLVAIAEKIDLSPRSIWLAVLLFSTCPAAVWELTTSKNDLALACFFIASLNAALLLLRSGGGAYLIPVGLGMGLLLGCKFSGIYYCVILAGIVGWVLALKRPKTLWLGLVGLAAALAYGGSWYVRNYLFTGNPFYPGEVRLAGYTLFPAASGSIYTSHTSIFCNLSPGAVYHFGKMLLRWGALPGILMAAGLYPFFLHAAQRGKVRDLRILLILWTAQIFCFISFIIHPLSAGVGPGDMTFLKYGLVLRYALPALAIGLFPTLWSLDPLVEKIFPRNFLIIGLIIFITGTLINPAAWLESFANLVGIVHPSISELSGKSPHFLLAGIVGVLLSVGIYYLVFQTSENNFILMGVIFLITVSIFPTLKHYRDSFRSGVYQTVLERKSGFKTKIFEWGQPNLAGRNLAVFGLPWYFFSGSALENRWNYISTSNRVKWFEEINKRGINTIIVGKDIGNWELPGFGDYPEVFMWIEEKDFSLVYRDELISVYNH